MKISKIEYKSNNKLKYTIYFIPNFFEKLLGFKPKNVEYKYTFDSICDGCIYFDDNKIEYNSNTKIGRAIDKFRAENEIKYE